MCPEKNWILDALNSSERDLAGRLDMTPYLVRELLTACERDNVLETRDGERPPGAVSNPDPKMACVREDSK